MKIYSCGLYTHSGNNVLLFPSPPLLDRHRRRQQAVGMLRSRYAADKDALDRGAYGSKTWDTVSTACPTQRIVDPNRIETQGNIRCVAYTARLPSSHSSNAFLK